jgi:hypothetical protein
MRLLIILIFLLMSGSAFGDVYLGGFMQGLYGGRLHSENPTASEYTVSDTRLQLRLEHYGDAGELFGRIDFLHDGTVSPRYEWELREGYFKFRLGSSFDIKTGRQILTWGTGDLIFINDVFAKDYKSFFVGRDDQYLKAPQDAIRVEYYSSLGSVTAVWTPRFEANRLPDGTTLSFFSPFAGKIVGYEGTFAPRYPESTFNNSEIALRYSRSVSGFTTALYLYRGFYKNPIGMDGELGVPVYPRLYLYGASVRGQAAGGILWIEGGYFDSGDDSKGDNPLMPNSSVSGLLGYERQIASNLTANVQWQVDYLLDHSKYKSQLPSPESARDEVRHLLTSRVTKLLFSENLTLVGFVFASPSDEDAYVRFLAEYKYTDEIKLAIGANLFSGEQIWTEFGQLQLNDNLFGRMTYWF